MRTARTLLPLLIVMLSILPAALSAQPAEDPVFAIEIVLKSDGKRLHNYQIILSRDQHQEDTISITNGKEVYVTLRRNDIYYFTFHKEGFQDRMVVVNTALPENSKAEEVFLLDFTVNMVQGSSENSETHQPYVFVKYDNKQDDFALCEND